MKKRLISLFSVFCILLALSMPSFATEDVSNCADIQRMQEDEEYRKYIQEEYDVFDISERNHVDPEELTDAIIKGIYSDKFSPFSEIEIIDSENEPVNESVLVPQTEHIFNNQDSTAYVATGNPGASGTMPWVGSCAVHKANSNTTKPLIPFGTIVYYLNRTVSIGGKDYNSFIVNDIGDVDYNRSLYWTDVFFGDNTAEIRREALEYGVKRDVQLYFMDGLTG
nr:hypothetical protein [uncultured Dysosmobacter sp.]